MMLTVAIKTHNVHFSGSASETNGKPQIYVLIKPNQCSLHYYNLEIKVESKKLMIIKVKTESIYIYYFY